MKLKVVEHCFGKWYSLNKISNEDLSIEDKREIVMKMAEIATSEDLDRIILDYVEHIGTVSKYKSDDCDQCGNWNYDCTVTL